MKRIRETAQRLRPGEMARTFYLRIALSLAAFCMSATFAAPSSMAVAPEDAVVADRSPAALSQDFADVLADIQRMVKTRESAVDTFEVRAATPERIERFVSSPQFAQQPKAIRENALIFAGRGALLRFEKPSDIIAKVSSWFPEEIANARRMKDPHLGADVHLYGPFQTWDDEAAAFMGLWNCMPQIAWLRPGETPFKRNAEVPFSLSYGLAAHNSNFKEADFGFCLRERNGRRPARTELDQRAVDWDTAQTNLKVARTLQDKFHRFLSAHRCQGQGPDDCVMVLHLWSSLSPGDLRLAEALRNLEPDIGLLPPPPWPLVGTPGTSVRVDAGAYIDTLLRQAAFLRAKLNAVLAAPAAWPADALAETFRQMSDLRSRSLQTYEIEGDYQALENYNDVFNPWGLLSDRVTKAGVVRDAWLSELRRLAERDPHCVLRDRWLHAQTWSPQADHSIDLLEAGATSGCGTPDWYMLRTGGTEEWRQKRARVIDLIRHTGNGLLHDALLAGLTNFGNDCFNEAPPSPPRAWIDALCRQWIHEPQTVPLALPHSKLKLDARHQFEHLHFDAPADGRGPLKPVQAMWLASLAQGMPSNAQAELRAYAERLVRAEDWVTSAEVWRHPGHSRAWLTLHRQNGNLPSLHMVLAPSGVQPIEVPERFFHEGQQIARISDLDEDGQLEAWWARNFDECDGTEADLNRDLHCAAQNADMGEVQPAGGALSYFVDDHRSTRLPPALEQWTSHGHRYAMPASLRAAARGAERTVCNTRLLGSFMSEPLGIDFKGGRQDGPLIDLACEAHPLHRGQLIVALFYRSADETLSINGNSYKGFVLAVVDPNRKKVLSLFRDVIEEDAAIWIRDDSLKFDTEPYQLAPGVRALGVRMAIGHSPRMAEGGESDYLTLFVEDGSKLRPILRDMAMSKWQIVNPTPACFPDLRQDDNDDACEIEYTTHALAVAPTITQGWHDLQVITTTSGLTGGPVTKVSQTLRARNKSYR